MDDADLALLAEPTRRSIVALLAERPRRAMSLADTLGLGSAAIARHLRVLREAGIVLDNRVARDGRVRLYALHPRRARGILAWLASASGPGHHAWAAGRWPKHVVAVQVGQHRFGILSDAEARLIAGQDIVAVPLGAKDVIGLVEVEGMIVAVLDLGRRMELQHSLIATDEPGCVVLVWIDGSPLGVRVGRAVAAGRLGAAEVRPMPPGATSSRAAGLAGVARVDGRLTVLVDPAGLMS